MKKTTLCALALTAASFSAFAVEKPDFKTVDANGDGVINMEEAKQVEGLAELLLAADADKDGVLNEEEYNSIS